MSNTTTVDLSDLPFPDAIEVLSFETMLNLYLDRFRQYWSVQKKADPTLPEIDVTLFETATAVIAGQADTAVRLLDRARVNEAISSLLVATARGNDLENVVLRQGVRRLTLQAATTNAPAVLETDAALLRRYLLSFDRPSAGSAGRYLYEAWTAWPAMADARVNGRAIHGRRGDTDIVVAGPGGRVPTSTELSLVRRACTASNVQPEAVSVEILAAQPVTYQVSLEINVPAGPDKTLIEAQVKSLIERGAKQRLLIGAEIPERFFSGIPYSMPNVLKVRDLAPVSIAGHPYRIPVLTTANVSAKVI